MSNKNTKIIFEYYNEQYEKYNKDYIQNFRKRANVLSLTYENDETKEQILQEDLKKYCYSHFFRDIAGWIKLMGISENIPARMKENYSEKEIEEYFESEEILKNGEKVEEIIYKVIESYKDISLKLVSFIFPMLEAQEELIKTYLASITEKNELILEKISEDTFNLVKNNILSQKKKLRDIDDSYLIILSKGIKTKIKNEGGKFNQSTYSEAMSDYLTSCARPTLIKRIKDSFNKDIEAWLDEL